MKYNKPFIRKDEHRKERLAEYGLTVAAYDFMLESQKGVCCICKQPETVKWKDTDVTLRLAVDHCHRTGKVRGLLCRKCNLLLGWVNEDLKFLRQIIQCLETRV